MTWVALAPAPPYAVSPQARLCFQPGFESTNHVAAFGVASHFTPVLFHVDTRIPTKCWARRRSGGGQHPAGWVAGELCLGDWGWSRGLARAPLSLNDHHRSSSSSSSHRRRRRRRRRRSNSNRNSNRRGNLHRRCLRSHHHPEMATRRRRHHRKPESRPPRRRGKRNRKQERQRPERERARAEARPPRTTCAPRSAPSSLLPPPSPLPVAPYTRTMRRSTSEIFGRLPTRTASKTGATTTSDP